MKDTNFTPDGEGIQRISNKGDRLWIRASPDRIVCGVFCGVRGIYNDPAPLTDRAREWVTSVLKEVGLGRRIEVERFIVWAEPTGIWIEFCHPPPAYMEDWVFDAGPDQNAGTF